ncbi:uncharacterized protein [Littorina saxatilis]|uniref:uncharacterized protein isoform X3 n=1 Tax=Littorina saxatilis TaxID=31220 RepID=UPI0038B64B48
MLLLPSLICLLLTKSAQAAECGSCVDPHAVPNTYVVKTYHESEEHVENPHRGFVLQLVSKHSQPKPLTKAYLDYLREHDGLSMIWRTFMPDTFVTSPLSEEYLNQVRHDLEVLASASFTAIIRFEYIFEHREPPPYGDASKNIVLHHISQLKPIFHQYERVITAIEAGFIGAWGEWFYTDYFGMPKPYLHEAHYEPTTGLTEKALRDRKDVLLALLNAAPKSIQVELRYVAQKMYLMGTTPTTFQDVQRGTDRARTGHHNDCFLSSDTDVGTYRNKAAEYPYLAKDTRYCVIGGETCRVTTNHRHECPTATKEMAMFHWTWLNEGFDEDIYKVWKQQGCYADVHKRLGYRLTITKAILPKSTRVNDNLCFHLEFRNSGYAAPVKHLKFYFILKSTSGSSQHYAAQVTGVDVRDWQPGYTHTVVSSVHLSHVHEGQYKVLVSLSDPLMGDRADYNVLLATTGVPLYTQGLNDLGHTITVSGQHTASAGCASISAWKPPAHGHYSRVFKGSFH